MRTTLKVSLPAALIAAAFIYGLAPDLNAGPEPKDKGAAMMQLDSGRLPSVPFPHHQHQSRINDCTVCHDMFPQKRGAIQSMHEKGEMEKKTVMNQNCIACHKKEKAGGNASGPLSCTGCHKR